MSRYVLDSFAILAHYWYEPGNDLVERLLRNPRHRHWMTVVNLGEIYYRIAREEGTPAAEEALSWIATYPLRFVDADRVLSLAAARVKASYALSYADCFAVAAAQRLGATIVTGDREFESLERDRIIEVEWLPKRSR